MASTSLLKTSPVLDKSEFVKGQTLRLPSVVGVRCHPNGPSFITVRASSSYADELVKTAKTVASPGRGILAMDESNATCGKRLASIGLENTEANRQAYRTLLVSAPGLGQYISGAILFEETLYQSTTEGKKMVDVLNEQGIVPGIKVDKGLVPLPGSNNESWCQGLDGLASRSAAYYQQGARFAKWRTVVSIPNGPSALAVKEAAWGLARYAAITQDNGLVPIVEPEILLDGEHGIDRTFEVAQKVWAETFFYLAENKVMFEGILLKPSMVTPGAECKDKATPEQFLSGGQSEVEATQNLNAMNQKQTPWHVSFSYARALQNTCLKTWGGRPENVKPAQDALLIRAKANSEAQLGKYTGEGESEEAKEGMEHPPSKSKRCKFISSVLKDPLSHCHACCRGHRLSDSSSDEEDTHISDFENIQMIVSMIRTRAMESKMKRSSMIESYSTVLHPISGELFPGSVKQLYDVKKQDDEENEEFTSVKSQLSLCSFASIDDYEAFYSVKTDFSCCPSLKDAELAENKWWSSEVLDSKELRRRAIIQEICHCKGWPFGLCRKALLLPPLPKSPSDSWSWYKASPNVVKTH
ncbi:hypothetical protein KSS87_007628 [Heliosperma pusillum]|nr:hypothetical protein KSS87_007628 [Heliosperma pusillum]